MIYIEPKSHTPITVTEGPGENCWTAAHIAPNGAAHAIKSKHLPATEKCEDAFEALRRYAEKKSLWCIDAEIKVNGSVYRLQADSYGQVKGIGYIKHLAQAKTTTAELPGQKPGKAPKGMSSWQKYTGPTQLSGWPGVVLEWTRLFLASEAEALKKAGGTPIDGQVGTAVPSGPSLPATVDTRPDNAHPGVQISGETLTGEVLPPVSHGAAPLPGPAAPAETIPAKRGRGRPSYLHEIAPPCSIEQHIENILRYHNSAQAALAQGAISALMCGFELISTKLDLGYGRWEAWVEESCPLSLESTRLYMLAAEGVYKRTRTIKRISQFCLGVSPDALDETKRNELIAAVKDATDGKTMQQLYFDLGVIKAPPKDRGGNAKLLTWLDEMHPEIEARREVDLPPDILAEWREYQASLPQRMLAEAQAVRIAEAMKFWHEKTAELCNAADHYKTHELLPTPAIESAAIALQTAREILLGELKARLQK